MQFLQNKETLMIYKYNYKYLYINWSKEKVFENYNFIWLCEFNGLTTMDWFRNKETVQHCTNFALHCVKETEIGWEWGWEGGVISITCEWLITQKGCVNGLQCRCIKGWDLQTKRTKFSYSILYQISKRSSDRSCTIELPPSIHILNKSEVSFLCSQITTPGWPGWSPWWYLTLSKTGSLLIISAPTYPGCLWHNVMHFLTQY